MNDFNKIWESKIRLATQDRKSENHNTSVQRNIDKQTESLSSAMLNSGKKDSNIFEIAEKIIEREKKNSKSALDEFWSFKNSMGDNADKNHSAAIEKLIKYYQKKMDVLREREEELVSVSQSSAKMLDDKDTVEYKISQLTEDLKDTEGEMKILQKKADKIRAQKEELEHISNNSKQKLASNINRVVNGIFEISMHARANESPYEQKEIKTDNSVNIPVQKPEIESVKTPEISEPVKPSKDADIISKEISSDKPAFEKVEKSVNSVFPKSVVKTNTGNVIGEYYYDASIEKEKRHYILNGKFFVEQIYFGIEMIKRGTTDAIGYPQLLQIATDGLDRVEKSDIIHFEVSTNEILNAKTVSGLIVDLRKRDLEEVTKFINRYTAKIEALGNNYDRMLKEQMKRVTNNL